MRFTPVADPLLDLAAGDLIVRRGSIRPWQVLDVDLPRDARIEGLGGAAVRLVSSTGAVLTRTVLPSEWVRLDAEDEIIPTETA